jgi:anaphase-promoting complex subunit 3
VYFVFLKMSNEVLDLCDFALKEVSEHYYSLFLYDNAKFFAERLYYNNPLSEHLYILAKCYFGQGKIRQVYNLLKDDMFGPNRYLFAQASIALGKYGEAETSLTSEPLNPHSLSPEVISNMPGGSAGLYLLGVICRRQQRKEYAIAFFQKCLEVYLA